MATSKFAGGELRGLSGAAVPTGAPASSASLRLSSFRAEVLDACALMDQGRKGYISARELKYVFVSCMGFKPSKLEITNMLSADPATERGVLTYSQVFELLWRRQRYERSGDSARQAFSALDQRQRGFLQFEDLQAAAADSANLLPLTTLLTIFGEADVDRNSKVGRAEFERVYHHQCASSAMPAGATAASARGDGHSAAAAAAAPAVMVAAAQPSGPFLR